VCYEIKIRGSEYPKELMIQFLENKTENENEIE